jgi:predicted ferric reductase
MSSVTGMLAGIVFVALAATNVAVMMEAHLPLRNGATRDRLIAVHRVGGYLFVIMFCIMAYSMSQKLTGLGITGHLPTYLVFHIVLVLALVPLLLLKILMARRYRQSHSSLRPLGLLIFLVSFVLVAIPAFSEILRSANLGILGSRLATSVVVAVCVVQCALVITKRMKSRVSKMMSPISEIPALATSLSEQESRKNPITLLLTQVKQQTDDARTLRFKILKERRLCAKPGQFLTFQWTVNGQRVPGSYTISSSPTHEDYVEITAKRMENGRVSVFLNELAKPGLEVEANGPYGRFYFDETHHKASSLLRQEVGSRP